MSKAHIQFVCDDTLYNKLQEVSDDRGVSAYIREHFYEVFGIVPEKPVRTPKERKTCTVDNCSFKSYGLGLCQAHYQQKIRGKVPGPIRRNHKEGQYEFPRLCNTCKERKGKDDFYWRSKPKKRPMPSCKACLIEKAKAYKRAKAAGR